MLDLAFEPGSAHVLAIVLELGASSGNNRRLYASADSGATWRRLELPFEPQVIAAAPGIAYAVDFAGGSRELLRSTDGGESWQACTPPDASAVYGVVASAASAAVVYALVSDARVLRSEDRCESWTQTALVGSPGVDPADALHVVTMGQTLEVSYDGGRTLHEASGPPDPSPLDFVVGADGNTVLSTSPRLGVLRTDDGGVSWSASADGLVPIPTTDIAVSPFQPSLVLAVTGAGVMRSSDAGRTWARVRDPGATTSVAFDPADTSLAYADSFLVSHDAGETWATLPFRPQGSTDSSDLLVHCDSTLMAPVATGEASALLIGLRCSHHTPHGTEVYSTAHLWRSDDLLNHVPLRDGTRAVWADVNGRLYATSGSSLLRSEDLGSSWRTITHPDPAHELVDLAFEPTQPATAWAATSGWQDTANVSFVWETTDAGRSWSPVGHGGPPGPIRTVASLPDRIGGIVAGGDSGVVGFSDGAWHTHAPGLPTATSVFDLEVVPGSPAVLWAATNRGIWTLSLTRRVRIRVERD